MALPALPRVAMAAVALALGLTATADAATMNVARRVEPTLDRYLFTPTGSTPLSAMTSAQRYLASTAKPLVVHDSDARVSQFLLGWQQRPNIAVYFNGTGINAYNQTQLAQAKDWLVSKGGQPVLVDGGWRMLDVRNPAARAFWLYGADGKASCNPDVLQRAALDLYACGYQGLWIDNALTNVKLGFTPTPDIDGKSWAKGVLALLTELRAKKPAGTTFTINMHWTDTSFGYAPNPKLKSSDPAVKAARIANQVIIEGGAIDPGLHYPLAASAPWSYRRLLVFVDQMHKQRTKVQWEMTSSHDLTYSRTPISGAPQLPAIPSCHDADQPKPWAAGDTVWQGYVRAAAFNWSSAVLAYKNGDSVGDVCLYPDRAWAGYTANLGKPLGKRKDKNGLLTRTLQRGVVVVNPNDVAKRVKLPKAGVNLASQTWPQSTAKVRALTLPPRTAAVIQY